MTPEQKAEELIAQYEGRALEVCETVFGALKVDYSKDQMALAKEEVVSYWWDVLLILGYES